MSLIRNAILSACCLSMVACSSGKALEDYAALTPSPEVTGSVTTKAPTPSAELTSSKVAAVIQSAEAVDVAAAAVGYADGDAEEPAVQAVAMAVVPKPKVKPAPATPAEKAVARGARAVAPNVTRQRFRDAHPINFGRQTPQKHAVHGVDVSRWQGNIDWPKLRSQGANFVYIKATDGGDHLDPMFRKNWREADEAGVKRGAYHFFYWCRAASEQADWFIRNVPKVAGALPPVIDVEWNGQSRCKRRPTPVQVREKMQVFMDRLERHYGQRPVIYTAPDFYEDNLKGQFKDYPFWLRSVAAHPSKVYPGREWVFWQYSGTGLSHGLSEKIDLNVFNGGEREWNRWLNRNASPSAS